MWDHQYGHSHGTFNPAMATNGYHHSVQDQNSDPSVFHHFSATDCKVTEALSIFHMKFDVI